MEKFQASNAADLILRRGTRQAVVRAKDLLRSPAPPLPFLPRLPSLPFPVPETVVDALSPKLTVEEVSCCALWLSLTGFVSAHVFPLLVG